MKLITCSLSAAVLLAASAVALPAQAMGSGNPYEDQQVGVSYTVYQPSYTVGLKTPTSVDNQANCPKGTDQSLSVPYGSPTSLQFTVAEGNPICSEASTGKIVLRVTIKGARATVTAYCDAATVKICTKGDVRKYGGHLSVTLPATKGLTKTMVRIETSGEKKLNAHQLVLVARSMQPVG